MGVSIKILTVLLLFLSVKQIDGTIYNCNSSAVCGCSRQPAILTRIVGGQIAVDNSWGWAVSLKIGGSLCGGSIISASWIITAAHCVNGATANQITVYAGSNIRMTGTQIKSVQTIYMHPDYSTVTFANDIALLRLTTVLDLSDPRISTICLPSVSSGASQWPPDPTTVIAVGWGTLSESGSVSNTLQQVTLQTVNYTSSSCSPLISNNGVQFCASGRCKDTCQGDSGGPLMAYTSSNQWVLVGLTSFGRGCARPQYAGVYTRVAALQAWIQTTTSSNFNPSGSNTLKSSTTEIDQTPTCSKSPYYSQNFLLIFAFSVLYWLNI